VYAQADDRQPIPIYFNAGYRHLMGAGQGGCMTSPDTFQLDGIPALGWLTEPARDEPARDAPALDAPARDEPARAEVADGIISFSAGPGTDWVADPMTGGRTMTAPALVFPAADSYVLSARVEVPFAGTFDAGVLIAYQDAQTWAKLCFEYSPQGRPMIVSVITRGLSDDCNSAELDRNWVYLRISRVGAAFVLHYSLDRQYWIFVRVFALGPPGAATWAGFLVQSPFGAGVTARFSEISYERRVLTDIRSGG
jgi:uncharacterized protein